MISGDPHCSLRLGAHSSGRMVTGLMMSLHWVLVTVIATIGFVAAGYAQPVPSNSESEHVRPQPSFNCVKADSSIELIICADAKLAELDARMGRAYRLALTRTARNEGVRSALIESQHQWIAVRNMQCNQTELVKAKPCIAEMTKARVEVLANPTVSTDFAVTSAIPPGSGTDQVASPAWDLCVGKIGVPADLQIGGCTKLIDSGQETRENLAIAYGNRGNGYQIIKDFHRAIADYDQAIESNPKDPIIFNNRGIAYGNEGDNDRAIADFTEAIRLDPNFAEALAHRGLLRIKRGDAEGRDDIAAAESLKPVLAAELNRQLALMAKPPPKQKALGQPPASRASANPAPANPDANQNR